MIPEIRESEILDNIIAAFEIWDEDLLARSVTAAAIKFGSNYTFCKARIIRDI